MEELKRRKVGVENNFNKDFIPEFNTFDNVEDKMRN